MSTRVHIPPPPVWIGYGATMVSYPQTKKAVLVDLDGTLLNNDHRQHFMQEAKPNWKAFFAAMTHDTVNPEVAVVVDLMYKWSQAAVILVTGRPATYQQQTLENLYAQNVSFSALVMRHEKDNRSDVVTKQEMLEQIKFMGYQPVMAIDDRPEVVHMWRTNGIRTLQTDPAIWERVDHETMDKRKLLDEVERLRERVAELERAGAPQ